MPVYFAGNPRNTCSSRQSFDIEGNGSVSLSGPWPATSCTCCKIPHGERRGQSCQQDGLSRVRSRFDANNSAHGGR